MPTQISTANPYLLAPERSQSYIITQSVPASSASSFVEEIPHTIPLDVPYEMIDMEDYRRYQKPTSQQYIDFGHVKSRFDVQGVEPVMTDIHAKPGRPRKVVMVSSPSKPLKLGQRVWVHGTLQGVWEITGVRYHHDGKVGLHWTNHETREIAPVMVLKAHFDIAIHKPEGRTHKILRTISMPFMNLVANRSCAQLGAKS